MQLQHVYSLLASRKAPFSPGILKSRYESDAQETDKPRMAGCFPGYASRFLHEK